MSESDDEKRQTVEAWALELGFARAFDERGHAEPGPRRAREHNAARCALRWPIGLVMSRDEYLEALASVQRRSL